jgi:tetratricopeptide (TPR) repeat protein
LTGQGEGEALPSVSPEAEAALAAEALDQGDFVRALAHLGRALYADPECPEYQLLLERIAQSQPDPLELVPPSARMGLGAALLRSLLLHRAGRDAEALRLLLQVAEVQAAPQLLPRLVAGSVPAAMLAVGPGFYQRFLVSWLGRLPGLRVEGAVLDYLIPLAERSYACWPEQAFGNLHVTFLRKAGRDSEAFPVAMQLYKRFPGWGTALSLGMLHSAGGSIEVAKSWYQQALSYKPEDVPTRNDLADLYVDSGDFSTAATLYNEVLLRDPKDSWALTSLLFCTMMAQEGGQHRLQLEQLAAAGDERAEELLRRAAPCPSH